MTLIAQKYYLDQSTLIEQFWTLKGQHHHLLQNIFDLIKGSNITETNTYLP
jgi:hypothetical protein